MLETMDEPAAEPVETKSDVVVIYHASCFDGFCAAWLLNKVYPDAEFLPYQHYQAAPDCTNKNVIIADFSFDRQTMVRLINESKSLLCFDHHETAERNLAGLPGCVFDQSKSGGRLVWDHYQSQLDEVMDDRLRDIPWLVAYTEDHDLWRFDLPNSRSIRDGLRLVPYSFDAWDHLDINAVTEQGFILSAYFDLKVEHAVHNAKTVLVSCNGGRLLKIKCVNVTDASIISLVGESLAIESDDGVGMTYFFDGHEFVFSLRSRDGFDCEKVASYFGGGGHKPSAGFRRQVMFPIAESE